MAEFAGVYDLAEMSRYLHVTAPPGPPQYSTLYRWVRSGLPTPSQPTSIVFTFTDLVSFRMIVALRIAGFSLQHIRRIHGWLQEATGYSYPFVVKDLWLSDTDIFSDMEGLLVSASRRGQYSMKFIKDWLRHLRRPEDGSIDLSFKLVDGREIASAWTCHPYVVLNPLLQFGAPCIEGTRIPTRGVWSMCLGGDTPQDVAKGYGVPLVKVQSAIEWEKKVAGLAA